MYDAGDENDLLNNHKLFHLLIISLFLICKTTITI